MKDLKTFIKSAFWTLFYQGVSLGFNFLLNIVLARRLGPAGKGLFSVYILTPSLLSMMLSLSMDESHVYFASKGYRVRDIAIISFFYTIISGILLVLTFKTFPALYAAIFKNIEMSTLFYAILITPLFLLFRYLRSIFLGMGYIKTYNFLDSMRIAALLVFVSSFILTKPDVGLAEKGVNFHILFALVITTILLIPHLKYGTRKSHILNLFGKELKYGLKAYLGITMSFFNRRLDVFILNYFRSPWEVGIYSISTALAELLWKLPNSIAIPLFPKVAREEKKDSTLFTVFITRITFFMLIVLAVLMFLIGRPIITLLFGNRFSASFTPLLWLLPGIVFLGTGRVISSYFHGINRPEYGSFFTIVSVIFTIAFDFILIPSLGAKGAAIASSIAYTVAGILAVALFSKEASVSFFLMFMPPVRDIVEIVKRLGD